MGTLVQNSQGPPGTGARLCPPQAMVIPGYMTLPHASFLLHLDAHMSNRSSFCCARLRVSGRASLRLQVSG